MPKQVPAVDVQLFGEAMSVSREDLITRMSLAASMLTQRGIAPWDAEPFLQRMQSLHGLLERRPDFKPLPAAALFEAGATCPLIIPPVNPYMGGDSVEFDESTFQAILSAWSTANGGRYN